MLRLMIVKIIRWLLVKLGRGGSLPGNIGLKMDSQLLSRFKMPKHVILVTGTNGKTTTSNLIVESLLASGMKVIGNRRGDNLREGIATLLCANSDLHYRVKADAVVLEVDELTIPRVFDQLPVSAFVVNNFFRDQLDRAGEMETIVRKIESVLPDYHGKLILNGNDPNVVRLADCAKHAEVLYFDVKQCAVSLSDSHEASEGKFCPRCGGELHYDYYQYSHIGQFSCPRDGFGRHEAAVCVESIDFNTQTMVVNAQTLPMFQNAIYAVYNCAAVLTLLKAMDISWEYAARVFAEFELNDGGNETFMINNEKCVLNLIKNPTGANEVMKMIAHDEQKRSVLIVLNDNDQDGRDVSWIWDAHFDLLIDPLTECIICSGTRAYDMALRLKYEGYNVGLQVEENLSQAIDKLCECPGTHMVISTYTALQQCRSILRRKVS